MLLEGQAMLTSHSGLPGERGAAQRIQLRRADRTRHERQRRQHGTGGGAAGGEAVDAVLLVLCPEAALLGNRLRGAQEEVSRGAQRIPEDGEQPLLQLPFHVDEKVAAGHQVQPGERRVPEHVVLCEEEHVPQLLGDAMVGA